MPDQPDPKAVLTRFFATLSTGDCDCLMVGELVRL
jgi:hypothetical protein